MSRVFIIVLDSCGIGEMPDAVSFGDHGVNTLRTISRSPDFSCVNLQRAGLGNIDGVDYIPACSSPLALCARMTEKSAGKDTTIGHWEIAGVISDNPLPTYPEGFPEDVIEEFRKISGRGVLCNKPYSGTEVIKDYGDRHLATGDPIVYTSADSVFQVAVHKDVMSLDELYSLCEKTRKLLCGRHAVGRVIARPFEGSYPFVRSAGRHDYSIEPPRRTLLDAVKDAGKTVYSIGKIRDIFAGHGITEYEYTSSDSEGLELCLQALKKDFDGLCFVNLVDFDMKFGHRRDVDGYAANFAMFDNWLGDFIPRMQEDDVLMITADHGCDPAYVLSTDHTREYTPLIVYGKQIIPGNAGTRETFADIAATAARLLGVDYDCPGRSLI